MIEAGGRRAAGLPARFRGGGRRRLAFVAAAAAVSFVAGPAAAGALATRARTPTVATKAQVSIKPVQVLARLLTRHAAHDQPGGQGKLVAVIGRNRPLTGAPTVLPVIARTLEPDGSAWLQVRLPGRPLRGKVLASTGWIAAQGTAARQTIWHIVVNTADRRAAVFKRGRQVRRFRVIVGKPSTPTPLGDYFVEENVTLPPRAPGAPYALATSARSHVLQEFEGGPGQIALHGLKNLGGTLGTAVSHGCIRFANAAITWLAARIPPGTPITIV
jgi:lipoprotein-anchoring transpeptidase ErfK/SrfK